LFVCRYISPEGYIEGFHVFFFNAGLLRQISKSWSKGAITVLYLSLFVSHCVTEYRESSIVAPYEQLYTHSSTSLSLCTDNYFCFIQLSESNTHTT